ncbi:N-acetylglucosamine-6-phosphate deacetylase, partial [Mycolicibacter senuensis]
TENDAALAAAVRMTATTPARVLGLAGAGVLAVGSAANLVVMDADLQLVRVMRRGMWLR